jgi:hypothetical protein
LLKIVAHSAKIAIFLNNLGFFDKKMGQLVYCPQIIPEFLKFMIKTLDEI